MIYMDNAASTQCDERVLAAMYPMFNSHFANPSNTSHSMGEEANGHVNEARRLVAKNLNCLDSQIVWTSGATESNNLAILGSIKATQSAGATRNIHVVTSSIEHKSVLSPLEALARSGVEVTFINPNSDGQITVADIVASIKDSTKLVSIMHANNETGVISNIEGVGQILKERKILFHTDASQTFGKFNLDVRKLGVDFLSFSAHKIYGPKGVGGLFVKDEAKIQPILHGGGQELGLRPGTLNVPGIVGLGKAAEISYVQRETDANRIYEFRKRLEAALMSIHPAITVNGHQLERIPNISSVSFPVKQGLRLTDYINNIALSTGSACDNHDRAPSHVMIKMGKSVHSARNTLRLSIGRFTTEDEIESVISELKLVTRGLLT
ncbi:cysteine desulfurase [Dyadobacter sandarakinus]|uniref:cysteine desulfurase n=2 Tax=Dyadobacter sandarakinus TaxID=2747268 RepID=A0ABX7I9L5_9BACT|nr:cysteine desulfurase [Dyadobacter sandarakinus]